MVIDDKACHHNNNANGNMSRLENLHMAFFLASMSMCFLHGHKTTIIQNDNYYSIGPGVLYSARLQTHIQIWPDSWIPLKNSRTTFWIEILSEIFFTDWRTSNTKKVIKPRHSANITTAFHSNTPSKIIPLLLTKQCVHVGACHNFFTLGIKRPQGKGLNMSFLRLSKKLTLWARWNERHKWTIITPLALEYYIQLFLDLTPTEDGVFTRKLPNHVPKNQWNSVIFSCKNHFYLSPNDSRHKLPSLFWYFSGNGPEFLRGIIFWLEPISGICDLDIQSRL